MALCRAGSDQVLVAELAANIEAPAEAAATLPAGALHRTLPWDVLAAPAAYRLTALELEEFRQTGEKA
jgi:transaldolase